MQDPLYFGETPACANPHEVEYLNPAIQIEPRQSDLPNSLKISVYLSEVKLRPVSSVDVRVYCGDPEHQATWYQINNMIWHFKDIQIPELRAYIHAPVEHCVWTGSFNWEHPKGFRLRKRQFALVAALTCEETDQQPTLIYPAADPCVAVFNSRLVP